jgi:outer membrane receptor protein involved in Fe transport
MAQDNPEVKDSVRNYFLPSIVVTAEKFENELYRSSSAISVLGADDIHLYPVSNASDLLSSLPGFSIYSKDGLGNDPVINTRGFYGGGEAEYVLFLIDGMEMNDLESGLVNWNLLSFRNVKKIESLRGGASAFYGDAAIGGIISVESRVLDSTLNSFFIDGGSYGMMNLGYNRFGKINDAAYNLYFNHQQTDGYRSHSKWEGFSFGGSFNLNISENDRLIFYSANQILNSEEPGPLSETELQVDRRNSSPYFKYDGKDENRYNLRLNYEHTFKNLSVLSGNVSYNYKSAANMRTFTNSAPILDYTTFTPIGVMDTTLYGDTKERKLYSNNINIRLNYFIKLDVINSNINLGLENRFGAINSKYYDYYNGFETDYIQATSSINNLNADGSGNRKNYSFYINQELDALKSLKFLIGLRYDLINDEYNSSIPDSSISASSYFFSPKVGLNFILLNTNNIFSSIYLNVNRSIKSPTLDQLTDLKQLNFVAFIPDQEGNLIMIPIKAPPFSNSLLKPQKSINYEIGAYYSNQITQNLMSDLSISAYQIDVEDEIDFDLESFRYQNINNTRHRGIETSIKLKYLNLLSSFLSYTNFDVRFRSGEYKDRFLKGIPQNVLTAGISYNFSSQLFTSLSINYTQGIYLDDDNTKMLPSYYTLNANIGYSFNWLSLRLYLNNLLDTEYLPAGYLLDDDKYYYPAAGRILVGSINVEL